MIDVLPQALVDAYAAFRRERRPDDDLTDHERRFPSLDDPAFELNSELSRRVRADGGDEAVLVPGAGVVAVIERNGAGGVAGLHQLLDGNAVGSSFRVTGRLLVSGLVPDDVPEVVVARRDGSPITVAVQDHLYAVEVGAETAAELPAEVVFVLAGVRRQFVVPGADDEVLSMRTPLRLL